jgi:hypothetical protein
MYGLPPDFDGAAFIGLRLTSVCFFENQVIFHFDSAATIAVESAYSIEAGSPLPAAHDVPDIDSNLGQLLGRAISAVSATYDGTLSLTFETGASLRVFDNSREFESYHITIGDKEIVV